MTSEESSVRFDWQRRARTGIPEVVFAQGKSLQQLIEITEQAIARSENLLMTRIDDIKVEHLRRRFGNSVIHHQLARCAQVHVGGESDSLDAGDCFSAAIVAAGSADAPLAAEIKVSLNFLGVGVACYYDVGVAGLWRLLEIGDELDKYRVLIAVAGMEGALFSVLAGMMSSPVIAVPSSIGYGVSENGHAALSSALASCAPGLAVVNIDNGFGAAALAVKMLGIGQAVAE